MIFKNSPPMKFFVHVDDFAFMKDDGNGVSGILTCIFSVKLGMGLGHF